MFTIMNIHETPYTNYAPFVDHYIKSNEAISLINKELLDYIKQSRHIYPPGKERARVIDSSTKSVYENIEVTKQRIAGEYQFDINQLESRVTEKKGKKIVSEYLIKNHWADSIGQLIDSSLQTQIELTIKHNEITNDPVYTGIWNSMKILKNEKWCSRLFEGESVPSAYILLSLLQHNLLATKQLMLNELIRQWHSRGDCFDTIGAFIRQKQEFVLENGTVQYDLGLCAYVRAHDVLSFQADEGEIQMRRDSRYVASGNWKGKANCLGLNYVYGTDSLIADDTVKVYPWTFSYFVLARGASLRFDSSNYCYRGIVNPVNISVPGYPLNKVSLRVPGSRVKKVGPGRYEVYVSDTGVHHLMAYTDATNPKGITSTVNITILKIINLPPPVAAINDVHDEEMSLSAFKNHGKITISARDSDFAIPYDFKSYQLGILKRNKHFVGPVTGRYAELNKNDEIRALVENAESGDKVYVYDVVVMGGGNVATEATPFSVTLK